MVKSVNAGRGRPTNPPGELGAAPPAAMAGDDEAPPASPSTAGMLLEDAALERNIVEILDDGETVDEQLTDLALDAEESWLEPLVA